MSQVANEMQVPIVGSGSAPELPGEGKDGREAGGGGRGPEEWTRKKLSMGAAPTGGPGV